MLMKEKYVRKVIRNILLKEYQKANQANSNYNASGLNRGISAKVVKGEKYTFNDLPVSYSQVSMSPAAAVAEKLHAKIGAASPKVKEGTKDHHKKIVELIHKPAYKMFRGSDLAVNIVNDYIEGLTDKAWSAWFLNRCYEEGNPGFDQIKKNALRFSHSGCCYPYALAAKNRSTLMNEPESLKGKELLIIVSKEEISNVPEFKLEAGVASVVGQGNGDPDWENIRQSFELRGGEKHMNIYTGSKWIGGNLGDSTSDKPNDNNAGGFMILVNVGNTVRSARDGERKDMKPETEEESNPLGIIQVNKNTFMPTIKSMIKGPGASEKFNVKKAVGTGFDIEGSSYTITMSVNSDSKGNKYWKSMLDQDILIDTIIKVFDSSKLKSGDVKMVEKEGNLVNLDLGLAKKIVDTINKSS